MHASGMPGPPAAARTLRLPSVVLAALEVVGIAATEAVAYERHQHQHRLLFPSVVVDVARDETGRRMSLMEADGRRWADRHGVGTPPVLRLEGDGQVLVGSRCLPPQAVDLDWLDACLDATERIARGAAPALGARSSWRAPRRTLPARAYRALAARVPIKAYLEARARVVALPRDGVAHGDFHLGNVLARDGRPAVVDWEFLGPAVRGTDALRLWATLPTSELRRHVAARIVSTTEPSRRPGIAVLARWTALHALMQAVESRRPSGANQDLLRAREVRTEAEQLVQALEQSG